LRRAGITIVAVEKIQVLHILCVCLWPWLSSMQSAYAVLYCHLWPVLLYRTSLHYLISGTILGKKVTESKMCILIFFTKFVWKFSHSRKNSARYPTDFRKENLYVKFHENPSSGNWVVPWGRVDGQTWHNYK
jgi:hypothetical protein